LAKVVVKMSRKTTSEGGQTQPKESPLLGPMNPSSHGIDKILIKNSLPNLRKKIKVFFMF
jgi:hypothetical protein